MKFHEELKSVAITAEKYCQWSHEQLLAWSFYSTSVLMLTDTNKISRCKP